MTNSLTTFFFSIAVLITSARAVAGSGFSGICEATSKIVAERTFQNEDGLVISFSKVNHVSNHHAFLDVKVRSAKNGESVHQEFIIGDEEATIMREVIDRETMASFVISVEAPFNVLRIRPQHPSRSEFISRECFYQTSEKLNVCYYKFKSENEVYVSIFKEIPNQ